MTDNPLQRLKRTVDRTASRLRRQRLRRAKPFGADEFERLLGSLGVTAGDRLLVHSSMDGFQSYDGKLTGVIEALKRAVSERGTLLLPTQPFTGSSVDYALSADVFDVRKTPSEMGLISELFRRGRDVVRSVHPTHPVAVWGSDVEDLIRGHHLSSTPCGDGTPYLRFGDLDGKILLLGTGIDVLTYYHGLEEDLERLMPWSPFTEEVFELTSRTRDGELVQTRNRLFEPDLSGRRDMRLVIPYFKARGVWREARLGSLHAIIMTARDLKSIVYAMAEAGEYCYHARGGRPYKFAALVAQRTKLALRRRQI